MVCKRPFPDEESCEIGCNCKHLRQEELTAQQSAVVEIPPCHDSLQKPPGEIFFNKSQDEGLISKDLVNEGLNWANMESEVGASGSISSYLWVNGNAIDEYAKPEAAIHLSYFPHYFELDRRVRALVQSNETYSTLLDHPPRKLVSVGPDYQVDVPEWASKSSDSADKSDANILFGQSSDICPMDNDDRAKMVGTCVIPMPDLESPAFNCCVGVGTGGNCNCLDGGSFRCVRQHVSEAREKLRENLGHEIFEELGFYEMGEEVSKRWSEEEEQAFHEVVLSNPASLRKNFWDNLSANFPSRTKKELVSYYFNVFMLQKRAEQNRFDPLNVDSDNDEWQRSEHGMTEEGDDSLVEYLGNQEVPVCNLENHKDVYLLEGIETCYDDAVSVKHRFVEGEEDEGDIDDVSQAKTGNGRN